MLEGYEGRNKKGVQKTNGKKKAKMILVKARKKKLNQIMKLSGNFAEVAREGERNRDWNI